MFHVMVSEMLFIQEKGQTEELEKVAIKTVLDLYDVMMHDVLHVDMRSINNWLLFCWTCFFVLSSKTHTYVF